jgi:hypothetical protein
MLEEGNVNTYRGTTISVPYPSECMFDVVV